MELANAIDAKRRERGEPESIIVWENVPGVLSSKDNAFGCFLAGLAGESSELQPAGGKWTHAGCVSGPERVIAWRVLDAQFFGVAQRRRRVFVVASARKGFDPAAVLFELDSVRRDTAPRRETQKAVAALTARGVGTCGADGNQAQAGHLIAMTHDQGGDEIKTDDPASELTCNHEAPIAAYGIPGNWIGRAPENGGNATEPMVDVSPCLTVADRHGVAYAFAENSHGEARLQDGDGGITGPLSTGGGKPGQGYPAVVAFQERGRADGRSLEINGDLAYALTAPNGGGRAQERNIADFRTMAVRRLTPIECERLQGFPDNHTLIGWRGKDTAECPDGPRYKAIGNSMAVPVMRWIGERIAAALPIEEPTPRNWQRPFLKWAGGKYSLLPELDRLIPAGKRLVEPFVGGGSVFLNSEKHESFLLADVNADLINLYQMLEVDHIRVCSLAKILFERANSEVAYKELRDEFNNQRMGAPERAAAFLFLNRHCFNGLIRYNRDGFFNVGWGKYEAPYFPEIQIKAFKQKSHKCVFLNAGYRRTLALAGEGDVVYCDPPYEPLPGTAGFTNYAAGGFSWADQISLAESCVAAHQRGAKVLINNSTAPRVLELYEQHGFILHHVDARRAISSKGSTRETAKDIVATLGV